MNTEPDVLHPRSCKHTGVKVTCFMATDLKKLSDVYWTLGRAWNKLVKQLMNGTYNFKTEEWETGIAKRNTFNTHCEQIF